MRNYIAVAYKIFIVCIVVPLYISCDVSKIQNQIIPMSVTDATSSLESKTLEDGAKFYVENREQYNYMDSLYSCRVLPALEECNYLELKSVSNILKDTPCSTQIEEWKNTARITYLKEIKKEINENKEIERQVFLKTVLPAIEMGVDSMLEVDIAKIMDQYAGGMFNYRKIAFIFGRNRDDFKDKFWEAFDTDKYRTYIMNQVDSYVSNLNSQQNKYYNDVVGGSFQYNIEIPEPEMTVGLSKSSLTHVQKYTDGESDAMLSLAFNVITDYATSTVLNAATGGLYEIYEDLNFVEEAKTKVGYVNDVMEIFAEDTKNVSKEDMVRFICEHDIQYQITNFYLQDYNNKIMQGIKKSNKELYNQIDKNL